MRGKRREAIHNLGLRSTGMEFASEMVVKAAVHGLAISEVPTPCVPMEGRGNRISALGTTVGGTSVCCSSSALAGFSSIQEYSSQSAGLPACSGFYLDHTRSEV